MYVVWQSRGRKNWDLTRHSARLVECVRVAGKPRQTFVAFLGSYETWAREHPSGTPPAEYETRQRLQFWRSARSVFETRGIYGEERARIEDALAQRIAPPTKAESYRDWEEGRSAFLTAMSIGGRDPRLVAAAAVHMASEPEKPEERGDDQ